MIMHSRPRFWLGAGLESEGAASEMEGSVKRAKCWRRAHDGGVARRRGTRAREGGSVRVLTITQSCYSSRLVRKGGKVASWRRDMARVARRGEGGCD
jgi:hypothetical protein